MSVKPILFNGMMVRAILDGRKTVTRRIVKPQPVWIKQDEKYRACPSGWWWGDDRIKAVEDKRLFAQMLIQEAAPYRPGDVLWVRETFFKFPAGGYAYKADANSNSEKLRVEFGYKWRPSIHMPREAARIWLRVTDVRVERLQEISGEDAKKEGIKPRHFDGCSACGAGYPHYPECDYEHCGNYQNFYVDWRWILPFAELWDNTIKHADLDRYGWDANPWVWVIEFKKCEKPEEA